MRVLHVMAAVSRVVETARGCCGLGHLRVTSIEHLSILGIDRCAVMPHSSRGMFQYPNRLGSSPLAWSWTQPLPSTGPESRYELL